MKALSFIKEAESNAEKAKAAAMANIMKQKAEIDARNAEVEKNKVEPAAPKAPEYDVEQYKKLLSYHDWYYDYSDDHSVWQRGHNERQDLYRMQDAIDSDYKIWNQYAPDMYKRVKTAEGKSTLPPHLAKLFNPDGTCKDPEMQKRWEEIVRKHNTKKKLQSKWIDVTPPGYGPADESCGSSHKKKKKVSEQDLDNELEYTGKLHKSIDFTSEHDDPSFCYDCKLVSTTYGEIDTEHDEADVVCPRCGSDAYVEASPEEIDKYASPEAWMNEAQLTEITRRDFLVKSGILGAAGATGASIGTMNAAGLSAAFGPKSAEKWDGKVDPEMVDLLVKYVQRNPKDYDGLFATMQKNDVWKDPKKLQAYKSAVSKQLGLKEAEGQKPYVCVHAKKGKFECHADTTYGAAKQAAQHWKLKSTAGIDVHLADKEMAWSESTKLVAEAEYGIPDETPGHLPGGPKMTFGEFKKMWPGVVLKRPSGGSLAGSVVADVEGWMNNPKSVWEPLKPLRANESIYLQHELKPGIYKHVNRDIMISVEDDGGVTFMQPSEWEIEGDQEYLEYVQGMLNEPSYWTSDLEEDSLMGVKDPVVVILDQRGKYLDKLKMSDAAKKYNFNAASVRNQLKHQDSTKIGQYTISAPIAGQPMESDISEGTDLGQLGNGVLLNQFNMGKGVVGLQITSNKNTGYVHLDLDAAKDLQKKLDQWIGMRDRGELARPGDMDESIENLESLTEAQFDEAAGEKDACYHKVKARYKVWPSAYASGALVQCRKVGAKNWGNKD